ncbi:MAG: hypothetical protein ACRD5M_04325 [Candidatus Acidiferrales bacterium]
MKKKGRGILLFTAFAVLFVCVAARATTLMQMSVAEMTRAADVVVRARCLANATGWDAGEIWTFTKFETEDVWKGAPPRVITVRLLGGRTENLTSTVDGVPRFQPGEDVVLFLEPIARGDFSIVSWMQGTFRVRRDRNTGVESVTQDTATFATFDSSTRRFEASGIRDMRLDALRGQVVAAMNDTDARNP